jgi:hypothetical protein
LSDTAAELRTLADALGLAGWELSIGERTPTTPDALAAIVVVWGQRRATVFLAPGFDTLPAETRRRLLTHELLHIWADPLREIVSNLAGVLGGPAHEIVRLCHADAEERMVDGIATAIARWLPLPKEER